MSQQEQPSKGNKKTKRKTYAKPGSLSFLLNKKRWLLTKNEIVEAIQSENESLLKLLKEQQSVAPTSEANGQSVDEQTLEEQAVEDQVQMNSAAPPSLETYGFLGMISYSLYFLIAEGISTKKTRGTTQMHKVHARKERKLIILNGENQPVGPTDEVVTELSSFLGILARTATLCPFDIFHLRNMKTKKDLWDYMKEKYIIPESGKKWLW